MLLIFSLWVTLFSVVLSLEKLYYVVTYAGTGDGQGSGSFDGDNEAAELAQLNFPNGVWADGNGTVFIADTYNHRIRYVPEGIIQTFAGSGLNRFAGDFGPALDAGISLPYNIWGDTG